MGEDILPVERTTLPEAYGGAVSIIVLTMALLQYRARVEDPSTETSSKTKTFTSNIVNLTYFQWQTRDPIRAPTLSSFSNPAPMFLFEQR